MITTAQFFLKHLGKEDNDCSIPGQCVCLIKSYYKEVLGLTPFIGNAKDYVNETRIPKVTGKPQPSDIVVFHNAPYDLRNGHIGIVVWSRDHDFECMEQNSPEGSPCHYNYHTDFKNILCVLRPTLPENSTPRPQPEPQKFTMPYTCVNVEPNLMENARQLLVQLSGGRIDCSFTYQQHPPIVPLNGQVFTVDEQVPYLKNFPIPTRFGFVKYQSTMSLNQMTTAEIPGTQNIVTFATSNNQDPMTVCYEFTNALIDQLQSKGVQISNPDNLNVTDWPTFIKSKLVTILPILEKGGII